MTDATEVQLHLETKDDHFTADRAYKILGIFILKSGIRFSFAADPIFVKPGDVVRVNLDDPTQPQFIVSKDGKP